MKSKDGWYYLPGEYKWPRWDMGSEKGDETAWFEMDGVKFRLRHLTTKEVADLRVACRDPLCLPPDQDNIENATFTPEDRQILVEMGIETKAT